MRSVVESCSCVLLVSCADVLRIFGGSDATVHYYMLHPHLKLREKPLEPYKLRAAGPPVRSQPPPLSMIERQQS